MTLAALPACQGEVAAGAPDDEITVAIAKQALTPSSSNGTDHRLNVNGFLAADTVLVSGTGVDQNFGGSQQSVVGAATYGGSTLQYRSAYWFDPWQLPSPVSASQGRVDVTSSALKLPVESYTSFTTPVAALPVQVSRLTSIWSEGIDTDGGTCAGGATWNRPNCTQTATWAGGDTNGALIASGSLGTGTGLQSISLGDSFVEEFNRSEVFNGLVVKPNLAAGVYRVAALGTREAWLAGTSTEPPQLEINYRCRPGYTNDSTFGPGGCTGDAGMACRDNGQCASGACFNGTCMGDNGAPCTSDGQCLSEACVSGRCEGFRVTTTATKDTYVQSAYARNRGGENELLVGRFDSSTNTFRALIDLPPASVPAPMQINGQPVPRVEINSAKVKLTQFLSPVDGQNLIGRLRHVNAAWVEGTNTGYGPNAVDCGAGGAITTRPNCALTTTWPSGYLSGSIDTTLNHFRGQKIWDLSADDVELMRSANHHGFRLELLTSTGDSVPASRFRYFVSREGDDVWGGPAPTLVVNYTCREGYTDGGAACLGEDGAMCGQDSDCSNDSCIDGICCERGCGDVECGAVCGVECGGTCAAGDQCVSGFCINHCDNLLKDFDETYVDCGGATCPACELGCHPQSECGNTGNAGESCGECGAGETCVIQELDYLRWGTCVNHCVNGLRDSGETDIDCGGACERCPGDCTCDDKLCGEDDGCGNLCTTGMCSGPARPLASSLPIVMPNRPADAITLTLGTVNDQWIGVRGNLSGVTDNGGSFGCASNSAGRDLYFHFNLCEATTVTIDDQGSTWNATLGLFPADTTNFNSDALIECSGTYAPGATHSITRHLQAGDYIVVLRGSSTASSGNWNLYLRDEAGTTPTCGGAGVAGQCGVYDRCPPLGRVLSRLTDEAGNDAVVSYGRAEAAPLGGHEGFVRGALGTSTGSTGSQLFYEGFEHTNWNTRWSATGTASRIMTAAGTDSRTGRPSTARVRLFGNAAEAQRTVLQTTIDTLNATGLRVRYSAQTVGFETGEALSLDWSINGGAFTSNLGARPTTWSHYDQAIALPAGTTQVSLRWRVNANSTGETADLDHILVTTSTAGIRTFVETTGGPTAPAWAACNEDGRALTAWEEDQLFDAPEASDTCPAILGSCACPANPETLTQTACDESSDCAFGYECMAVPEQHCARVTGNPNAICPIDDQGTLVQKYCARPFDSCAGQPALGCFSGAATYSTPEVGQYIGCIDPAQIPCKQIHECPAPDAKHEVNPNALPNVSPLPAQSPALQGGLLAPCDDPNVCLYPPLDSFDADVDFVSVEPRADRCHAWSIARDNGADDGFHRANDACESRAYLGKTRRVPAGTYTYSNCSEQIADEEVAGIGNSKLDVRFDPSVYKHVNVRDLPLGDADLKVDAGMRWEITPVVWGHEFTLLGVDAAAGATRCGVDVHADVTLLEQDIDVVDLVRAIDGERFPYITDSTVLGNCRRAMGLPRSVQDVIRYNIGASLDPEQIDAMLSGWGVRAPYTDAEIRRWFHEGTEDGFVRKAHRAKKALIDARHVMQYWEKLSSDEHLARTFCEHTRTTFPDMENAPCDVSLINRWIGEYNLAVDAMERAARWLRPDTFGGTLNQQGQFTIANHRVPFDVLAVSFAFPVGPLSVLMEVSAGGYWGVGGELDYAFMPTQIFAPGQGDVASVEATITPAAGAWVRLFVGAGVGGGLIGIHVGVSGELMVAEVSLPLHGRAALRQENRVDPRGVSSDWGHDWRPGELGAPALRTPNMSMERDWKFSWDLDARAQMTLLSGKLDLAARIALVFHTIQISKTILDFTGITREMVFAAARGTIDVPDPSFGKFGTDVPFVHLSPYSPFLGTNPGELEVEPDDLNEALGMPLSKLGWAAECSAEYQHPVD